MRICLPGLFFLLCTLRWRVLFHFLQGTFDFMTLACVLVSCWQLLSVSIDGRRLMLWCIALGSFLSLYPQACDAAIATSGSVVFELLRAKLPMAVVYRGHFLTELIAKQR